MTEDKRDWKTYSQEGVFLRFIMQEDRKHKGSMAYDWLLVTAKKLGIPGGSAFHGMAGYGRHGVLHEQHFFELTGLPVEVRFVCAEQDAYKLLDAVEEEQLSLFYVLSPTRFGIAGIEKKDWIKALLPID